MSITANPFPNHDPSTSVTASGLSASSKETTDPTAAPDFVERRAISPDGGQVERRQFASSHSDLSPEARELATAIDRYKIDNRRRYITCEEMLSIVKQLGYRRD